MSAENSPFLIYQNVNLNLDMVEETISAVTVLWLGFKTSVKPGTTFNLHCRNCQIEEVTVNNIPAEVSHNDPLKDISFGNKKMEYSSEELDLNYRASLEISRNGELEITVPYLSVGTTEPIPSISKHAHKDVLSRYDKLMKQYKHLVAVKDYDKYNIEPENEGSEQGSEDFNNKPCYLLQVKIKYTISSSNQMKFNGGVMFRKAPHLTTLFDNSVNKTTTHGTARNNSNPAVQQAKAAAHCVYTASYSHTSLYCIDGVRCWLPCIDSLDQRAVYDISITASNNYAVTCSGTKIGSTYNNSRNKTKSLKTTRFFSPTRIAAMSVGFFVGKQLEGPYVMPLYKVQAKILVATGLNDYISTTTKVSSKDTKSSNKQSGAASTNGTSEVEFIKRIVPLTGSQPTLKKRLNVTNIATAAVKEEPGLADGTVNIKVEKRGQDTMDVDSASILSVPSSPRSPRASNSSSKSPRSKRMRIEDTSSTDSATTGAIPSTVPTAADSVPIKTKKDVNSGNESAVKPKSRLFSATTIAATASSAPSVVGNDSDCSDLSDSYPPSQLYSDAVHHSTLGLDMALRIIHKFTSHSYDYENITIIYVYNLGAPFLAYDHFILVDATHLNGSDVVFMETTSHLLLLKAYLYSWLKSSIYIGSYLQEYVVHGVTSYILNYYIESIYGEDEFKYYYQKQYDAVISLEKSGQGIALAHFYPETYSTFCGNRNEYLYKKSAVIFQLLENKIANGRDPLRLLLKQLIVSPSLYKSNSNNRQQKHENVNINNTAYIHGDGNLSPLSFISTSPYNQNSLTGYHENYNNGNNSGAHSPALSASIAGDLSPYIHGTAGDTSPYPYANAGSQSPYAYAANAMGSQSPYVTTSGSMSPYSSHHNSHNNSNNNSKTSTSESAAYIGSHTPGHCGGGDSSPTAGYPPSILGLTRQSSNQSDYGSIGGISNNINSNDINQLQCPELVTPETFLLLLRNASGVSSEIDEHTFLDKYVYSSGVMFLKIQLSITDKVENAPRHIHMYTKQIGYHQATSDILTKFSHKTNVKMRLAEVRDDIITEPSLQFGDAKDMLIQQAYSRPGRRGGRRRGGKREEPPPNESAEDFAERERKEREKEMRKSALQIVRELDYPIKYAVMDPLCCELTDVINSSNSNMLIEQLYCDLNEHSIYFQCQALRNLAYNSNITLTPNPISSHSSGGNLMSLSSSISLAGQDANNRNLSAQPQYDTHTNNLALKAMANVLLGLHTNINDSKTVNGLNMSIYIRAEAAFALANYQNNHAPNTVHNENTHHVSTNFNTWEASTVLIACLIELYCEHSYNDVTGEHILKPLPNDLSNESSTYLKNSILLALSTIRTNTNIPGGGSSNSGGFTPLHVVNILLLFTKYLETNSYGDDVFTNDNNSNNSRNTNIIANAQFDDTQYKAVLYIVLSRLRFESAVRESSTDTMVVLATFIKANVAAAYTQARALARIKFRFSDANMLPELTGNGLDIAAAITVLSEIDIQGILLYARNKGRLYPAATDDNNSNNSNNSGSTQSTNQNVINQKKMNYRPRDIEYLQPSGVGVFTGFNYKKYFLTPGTSLKCTLADEQSGANKGVFSRDEIIYHVSSAAVKLAAFEGFVRICFSLYVAHTEIHKQQSAHAAAQGVQAAPLKDSTFIAATVEALTTVLKSDHDQATKQQFAQVFADVVQDKPARVAVQGVAAHNPWFCSGWSDVHGYTQPLSDNRGYVAEHRAAMNSLGPHMRVATKLLWRTILTSSCYDQSIRAILLETWIYSFGRKIPRALAKENPTGNAQHNPTLVPMVADKYFDNHLKVERFDVRSAEDLSKDFEKLMTQPLLVVKVKQQITPAAVPHLPPSGLSSGAMYNPFANPQHLNAPGGGGSGLHSSSAGLGVGQDTGSSNLKLSLSMGNMRAATKQPAATSEVQQEKLKFVFK